MYMTKMQVCTGLVIHELQWLVVHLYSWGIWPMDGGNGSTSCRMCTTMASCPGIKKQLYHEQVQ
ncbi:hypothetical protein BDA96_01G530300 [Sorghum bicolor]|uniref:Uncharacterized protein n=1 Tax=Sorghum bicolor TaxID=4558 RepID=A0A921S618_SORBI|nr:hypothetical protein BDA96_01G530300 [Sorghum bicolor]